MTFEEFVRLLKERRPVPPLRDLIVSDYKKAIAHTRGVDMAFLLRNYRKQEDKHDLKRREDLLEPIAKDIFDRTTDDIVETLDPQLVNIECEESVVAYMEEYGLVAFFQKEVIPAMLDDPNGFLVAIPRKTASGAFSDTARDTVEFRIVNFDQVVYHDQDTLVYSQKQGEVEYFRYLDRGNFREFYLTPKQEVVETEASLVFPELAEPPFMQLGGKLARSKEGKHYYQSFFHAAFAHATKAVQCFSDRETMRMTAHPILMVHKIPCDAPGCNTGRIFGIDGVDDGSECGSCHGSGFRSYSVNINDTIALNSEDFTSLQDFDLSKLLNWASPPLDAVKLNDELSEKHLKKAESALNLIFVDQAQSGKAKEIDRERHTAMINTIAKNVYLNLIRFAYQQVSWFWLVNDPVKVEIPEDFRSNTASAILAEITELKTKGTTTGVLYPVFRRLYKTMYAQEPVARKKALFELDHDPLHLYTGIAEKQLAAADARQLEFSKQLPMVLNQIAYENPERFLALSSDQITAEVEQRMRLPEIMPIRTPDGEVA